MKTRICLIYFFHDFTQFRGESHIESRMQCAVMTLTGGGAIINDALKFRQVHVLTMKLTINIPERRHRGRSGVFIINFELFHIFSKFSYC